MICYLESLDEWIPIPRTSETSHVNDYLFLIVSNPCPNTPLTLA